MLFWGITLAAAHTCTHLFACRSHFDHRAWVKYLREDATAQEWFAKGVVFCNDTSYDVNGALRTLLSEHVREHVIEGVSENVPKEVGVNVHADRLACLVSQGRA
jgi:hypothetical protein